MAQTVLVVDDSPTDAGHLTGILRRHGYDVLLAKDGAEALTLARARHPDLILMDVVMPGMNGFEATRQLARDPSTETIPVIVCSSKGQQTDQVWGRRQGARDYLVKPVTEGALLSSLRALA